MAHVVVSMIRAAAHVLRPTRCVHVYGVPHMIEALDCGVLGDKSRHISAAMT